MGRFAVPSALAIGSMAPDLWYFVPLATREDSHSLAGLAWFCLPLGVLAYLLFYRVLKQPLIALVSPRLAAFTCPGLPPRPWHAVGISLCAGAATHVAWDAPAHLERWLQHASTLAGSALLAVWVARKLAFDLVSLRHLMRTAGLAALGGLSVALLVYCLLFQRKIPA